MKRIKVVGIGLLALVGISVHARDASADIVTLTEDFEAANAATYWPWWRSNGVDGHGGITAAMGHTGTHSAFITMPRGSATNTITMSRTFIANTSHKVQNCAVAMWFFIQPDAHGFLEIGDPFNSGATRKVSLDTLPHNTWTRLGVADPDQFGSNWVGVSVVMTNTGSNQAIWFDDLAGDCETY